MGEKNLLLLLKATEDFVAMECSEHGCCCQHGEEYQRLRVALARCGGHLPEYDEYGCQVSV